MFFLSFEAAATWSLPTCFFYALSVPFGCPQPAAAICTSTRADWPTGARGVVMQQRSARVRLTVPASASAAAAADEVGGGGGGQCQILVGCNLIQASAATRRSARQKCCQKRFRIPGLAHWPVIVRNFVGERQIGAQRRTIQRVNAKNQNVPTNKQAATPTGVLPIALGSGSLPVGL